MKIRLILAWLLAGVFLLGVGQAAAVEQTGNPPPTKSQKIIVTSPRAHQVIHSPLTVAGKARGAWFFEGTFPVKLLDGHGQEVTTWVPVHAKNDWMTDAWVPFEATLEFNQPATATGTLLFQNDNPSGLPENQEEFRLPVRFR
jgi:hypothetical protein